MTLNIKSAEQCALDQVSLGECMIRLSPPGHGRIEFAGTMEVWVGGGEYNVAYALSRLGLRTGWVGGLVDNPLGELVRHHARAGGLNLDHAVNVPYDGVGRDARIGLNFTEVGTGVRPSVTMYDRGHSATMNMKPGDVDFAALFDKGVRWFHTGGIFACLSEGTRAVTAEALEAANAAGTIVSYDLNFRSKLWSSEDAIATTRPLVPFIDCLIGNEEDFQKVLGYEVEGAGDLGELPIGSYKKMVRRVAAEYPNLKVIGTTLREVQERPVEQLVGDTVLGRGRCVLPGAGFPESGNRGPRRRRRRICERLLLRLPDGRESAAGREVGHRARRLAAKYTRRYVADHVAGTHPRHEWRLGTHNAITRGRIMSYTQDLFSLSGKTAVVIGGTGELCGAMAVAMARAGAELALVGRNEAKARARLAEIEAAGGRGYFAAADVTSRDSIADLLEAVVARSGKCEVLVNGARHQLDDAFRQY